MAKFTFTPSSYGGEALAGFMASTLLEADSVKRGLLTVINDVKYKTAILDVDDEIKLQEPSGVFNDQGTEAFQNETYLKPVAYEFMKEEQWDNLVKTWESQRLAPGAFGDYEGVVDLSDFMVQRYLTKIQIANERLYWLGKASTPEAMFNAEFTGLLPLIAGNSQSNKVNIAASTSTGTFLAGTSITTDGTLSFASGSNNDKLSDGDVVTIAVANASFIDTSYKTLLSPNGVPVNGQSYFIRKSGNQIKLVRNYNNINSRVAAQFDGTSGAVTLSYINASNVLTVLNSVYSQLDPADRAQEDFNLQVPLHVGYAYAQAQANNATNVLNAFTDKKKMDYLGLPLQLMNHWQANTILGARSSNLFLGVDLLGDQSELSTVYMKPYTNDNVVRMKARMKAAVNFKFANELFYLAPIVPPAA